MNTTTSELNEQQQAAVDSDAPNILCISGPGSGKTKTLCARVERLVRSGAEPASMVVITYTNAAASVLEQRIGFKLGFVGTLHAFCLRLLTEHGRLVGLPVTLSVVDDEQKEAMVETMMGEMGVKCSLKKVLELFDRWPRALPLITKEGLVVKEYYDRLRASGLLDFDSILEYGRLVVNRMKYEKLWTYDYLFCDEFQDSSDADVRVYDAMPCVHKFFVGDGDQAIYGFRGGNVGHIFAAARDSGVETHKMEVNYRSGSSICAAAQSLIEHNKARVNKHTVAARSGGTVLVQACASPAAELCWVMEQVQDMIHMACEDEPIEIAGLRMAETYADIAVLTRTNWLASQFAEFLKVRGVPVADRKLAAAPADWKTAKLLITVMANPYSDFAVHQYNLSKCGNAIGQSRTDDAVRIKSEAAKAMVSINEYLKFPYGHGDGSLEDVDLVRHGVSSESRERVHAAARALSGRGAWTLNDLLLYLASGEEQEDATEGVFVGTLHASKGREFGAVFIVGCEEGFLPSARSVKEGDAAVEEERRIMFVGMTRAKERLCLSWCEARPQSRGPDLPPGPMEPRRRSRFVTESDGL